MGKKKVNEGIESKRNNLILGSIRHYDCGMSVSCYVSPHLTFNITTQSNNLTYLCEYSERQEYIYNLIKELHDSGLSYRKITKYLNDREIPTHRGKRWGKTGNSVYSVLKRKKQRDSRIHKLRNKEYKTRYSNFQIEYLRN